MLDKLQYKSEPRIKKAFYASDYNKSALDLYFGFMGIPATNPPQWFDTLKWGAGNGVEDAILKIFKDSGVVQEDYDQKEHGRIEIEREGVQINGYIDAIGLDGFPIEVKSINNANRFDVKNYEEGNPRENYVGQLSIYMDALGVDSGSLFVSSIDGLHRFWIPNERKELNFKCGNTTVDLDKEYKRWADIYNNHVVPKVMPDVWEYVYKIPVDKIDWTKQSKTNISKARNGHKVIGDWQILYSSWKDYIIELQGETLGYTHEEMEYIRSATKNYTKW